MWTRVLAKRGAPLRPLPASRMSTMSSLPYAGERVYVSAPDGSVSENGVLRGVDSWGRALVELSDGAVREYDSSRVSLRPVR